MFTILFVLIEPMPHFTKLITVKKLSQKAIYFAISVYTHIKMHKIVFLVHILPVFYAQNNLQNMSKPVKQNNKRICEWR